MVEDLLPLVLAILVQTRVCQVSRGQGKPPFTHMLKFAANCSEAGWDSRAALASLAKGPGADQASPEARLGNTCSRLLLRNLTLGQKVVRIVR